MFPVNAMSYTCVNLKGTEATSKLIWIYIYLHLFI